MCAQVAADMCVVLLPLLLWQVMWAKQNNKHVVSPAW